MPKGKWKRTKKHNLKNSLSHKGQHYSLETEFRKGNTPWNKGKRNIYSKKTIRKMSQRKKGKPSWNKGLKGLQIAWNKGLKGFNKGIHRSIETRRKMSIGKMGIKNYRWKGGVAVESKRIRKTLEYRLWREAVFKRDCWTCVFCGQKGGRLEPDHIKPFALYPELRFAIDNGRTLCKSCNKKTDTWGGRTNHETV